MKKLFKIAMLVLLMPLSASADLSAKAVLNQVYSYKEDNDCWLATDNEHQTYCMEIAHNTKTNIASGQRLYVLATGCISDEQGEKIDGMNGVTGLVGAFVAEERQGKLVITYRDTKIKMGSYGCPPANKSWKFVQLGNNNYWGWQGRDGFHAGAGSAFIGFSIILAPCAKKSICNLTPSLVISGEDTGSIEGKDIDKLATIIDSTLEFDLSQADSSVFPLKVTMTGKVKNKKVKKSWTLPFDSKKWQYIEPAKWPLGMVDDGVLNDKLLKHLTDVTHP